jgi:hypothetical protein
MDKDTLEKISKEIKTILENGDIVAALAIIAKVVGFSVRSYIKKDQKVTPETKKLFLDMIPGVEGVIRENFLNIDQSGNLFILGTDDTACFLGLDKWATWNDPLPEGTKNSDLWNAMAVYLKEGDGAGALAALTCLLKDRRDEVEEQCAQVRAKGHQPVIIALAHTADGKAAGMCGVHSLPPTLPSSDITRH